MKPLKKSENKDTNKGGEWAEMGGWDAWWVLLDMINADTSIQVQDQAFIFLEAHDRATKGAPR
jgi:hypothetical protein